MEADSKRVRGSVYKVMVLSDACAGLDAKGNFPDSTSFRFSYTLSGNLELANVKLHESVPSLAVY